jgi:hypothetical protein
MIKIEETRTIFDKNKVYVGDIVEWNEYQFNVLFKEKLRFRNVGLVIKFEPETLWVKALGVFDDNQIGEIGLPVERTDITVLKRNPLNEK